MRLLLDTCTFLWITLDSPQLSDLARSLFLQDENRVFLSPISAWEMRVKYALGRLPLPESPEHFIPQHRRQHEIEPLLFDEEAALACPNLPLLHKDPFDRMLICQAIHMQLTILTPDPLIRQYEVQTLW